MAHLGLTPVSGTYSTWLGFLNLETIAIWCQTVLCHEGLSVAL